MSIATYDLASLTYDSATTTFDGYPAGLSTQPVVGVFIAFDDGAYVAEPNWVEVTQFVREISVRRGRGDDLQNFPSGTANVTLDNRSRLFDPFNTAGVYYGKLKPRRQIRIVGQWAGVNYPMFRGYVAGWPVGETDAGKDSTVVLDCFDALGLLAADENDANLFNSYMLSLAPVYFWSFSELAQIKGETSVVIKSAGSRTDSFTLNLTNQAINSPPTAGVVAPMFGVYSPQEVFVTTSTAASTRTGDVSCVMMFQTGSGRFNYFSPTIDGIYDGSLSGIISLTQLGDTAATNAFTYSFRVAGSNCRSSVITADDLPHLIVGTYTAATGLCKIFVDGVDVTVAGTTQTNAISPNIIYAMALRSPAVYAGGSGSSPTYGQQSINNLTIFHRVLSQAEITLLKMFAFQLQEESSLARYQRVMSFSDFAGSLVEFPASTSGTVEQIVLDQRNILELLHETAAGEDGDVYVDAAGDLVLTNRERVFNSVRSNTSQVTFTDVGTGVGYDADSLSLAFDADHVRNVINVSATGNVSAVAKSVDSVSSIGAAGESVSTVLKNVDEAQVLADRLVTIYKNPKLRIDPFSVHGGRDPSYAWPLLLSLELLDRFTFKRTPSVGSAIVQDMLLQSVEHNVSPGSWVTTINGSARYTGWFIVGVSLIGGTDVLL